MVSTTTVPVEIPEDLKSQLQEFGLLQDRAFVARALRAELERYLAWQQMQADFAALDAVGNPISEEEINAVIRADRAEQARLRKQRESRS